MPGIVPITLNIGWSPVNSDSAFSLSTGPWPFRGQAVNESVILTTQLNAGDDRGRGPRRPCSHPSHPTSSPESRRGPRWPQWPPSPDPVRPRRPHSGATPDPHPRCRSAIRICDSSVARAVQLSGARQVGSEAEKATNLPRTPLTHRSNCAALVMSVGKATTSPWIGPSVPGLPGQHHPAQSTHARLKQINCA